MSNLLYLGASGTVAGVGRGISPYPIPQIDKDFILI